MVKLVKVYLKKNFFIESIQMYTHICRHKQGTFKQSRCVCLDKLATNVPEDRKSKTKQTESENGENKIDDWHEIGKQNSK